MNISYCTNVYGRLWQLKQTLPHNLNFTKTDEVELCVLAYNDDSIEPYLIEHFSDYLNDGRLKIQTHTDDKPYSFGYVKRLSHAMGIGRVLFNLDADNFIDGVHDALLDLTDQQLLRTRYYVLKDGRGGRIGMTRNTYDEIGGYRDPRSANTTEDNDLIMRAVIKGKKLCVADCDILPLTNQQ